MKKEPINKEAFGYVRLHTYMEISKDEFILIESYIADMLNKLNANDMCGDADMRDYVHQSILKENILISRKKVDSIVNALYDFMFDQGYLIPISLEFELEKWYDWDNSLSIAIRRFISQYDCSPNIVKLSSHTKSQIEYVTSISPKVKIYGKRCSVFYFSDVIDNKIMSCSIKFQIDDSLPNKCLRLIHIPNNDDDNDRLDHPNVKTPSGKKVEKL